MGRSDERVQHPFRAAAARAPAALERGNAGEKFKLRARPEDFASNLSLEAYLDRVHGIRLPAFEASEGFEPIAYIDEVAEAVAAKADWSIQHDDIALGFFSFAKFLMYCYLDPATWTPQTRISEHPLVRGLLAEVDHELDTVSVVIVYKVKFRD